MKKDSKGTKIFTLSNAFLVVALIFVAALLFVPEFKGNVISGLMKIGLFQANIQEIHIATPLSQQQPGDGIILRDKNGQHFSLDSLKGHIVFINLWATWCPPCKAELPSINKLKKHFENNKTVIFLTIDADGAPQKAAGYLAQQSFDLPVYALEGRIPQMLSPDAIPYTIVLDKGGFIVYRHSGAADYSRSKFIDFMERLADNNH
ncbi:MAG TPA: redoxin family protein [Edaphocola sp.]|nr:redoxin family protein [Edaphocola sp.]